MSGKAIADTSSPCTAVSFTASPTVIQSGQSATLTWTLQGACLGYNVWFGAAAGPTNISQLLYSVINSNLQLTNSGTTGPLTSTTTFYFSGNNLNTPTSTLSTTVTVQPANNPPPPNPPANYSGHNVLINGTVYWIYGSAKFPYTSAGAFLSYGFNNWAGVTPATADEANLPTAINGNQQVSYIPPRNGSLINDHGTIYLITNGMRAGFSSAQVFTELGYSFSNASAGDTSFLQTLTPINSSQTAHFDGTLVNDHGTIYLMQNNTREGIPSVAVFNSWGLKFQEVIKANSFDLAAPVSGVLQTRMANQFGI